MIGAHRVGFAGLVDQAPVTMLGSHGGSAVRSTVAHPPQGCPSGRQELQAAPAVHQPPALPIRRLASAESEKLLSISSARLSALMASGRLPFSSRAIPRW